MVMELLPALAGMLFLEPSHYALKRQRNHKRLLASILAVAPNKPIGQVRLPSTVSDNLQTCEQ